MNINKSSTITLAILISVLTVSYTNAQLLNLSVKGGMNLSDISGDHQLGVTKMHTGFNIYVSKDFINFSILAVSGEIGFTQKGFDQDVNVFNIKQVLTGKETVHTKLNYIDISLLGKLRTPGGTVFPYVLAGPSLGLKTGTNISPSASTFQMFSEGYSSTSFGIKLGLGLEVELPNFNILAEARYNPDLTTSYDDENSITVGHRVKNVKNKVYEFIVGVKF